MSDDADDHPPALEEKDPCVSKMAREADAAADIVIAGDQGDLLPMSEPHTAVWDEPRQLATLEAMRQEGKLDLIGVSNVTLEGARAAAELVDLGEVQNAYSVMDRFNEPVLDFCREREIAFVPFFPLGSAFTGGPKTLAEDPAVSQVAARRGATPTQVALAWLLARYDRILLIPGTTSVAHLEENMAAADVALDDEDMATLEGARQVGPPQH